MQSMARSLVSFEEYLAIERESGIKHEYCGGEIFAMAGGSPEHNTLQFNLSGLLYAQLRGGPCRGFPADQRVWIEAADLYTYPDLSVVCKAPDIDAHQSLKNPTLLAEILSPSTEAYDRGAKLHLYPQIPSLRHYLLISQDRRMVHLYNREPNGRWTFDALTDLDAIIPLPGIGCTVPMRDLYERLEFPPPSLHPRTGT